VVNFYDTAYTSQASMKKVMLSDNGYYKQKNILEDQLKNTEQGLPLINMGINQTREALQCTEGTTSSSVTQAEMRFSRALDLLNGKETQRSALLNRRMELQKQLLLRRKLEIVQAARELVGPAWPSKVLIVAIADMLELMAAVFAAPSGQRASRWRPRRHAGADGGRICSVPAGGDGGSPRCDKLLNIWGLFAER
jgi:hypothetical protein